VVCRSMADLLRNHERKRFGRGQSRIIFPLPDRMFSP
jgi:hypothetical protein